MRRCKRVHEYTDNCHPSTFYSTFVLASTFASEMHRLINWQGDKYVLALPVDRLKSRWLIYDQLWIIHPNLHSNRLADKQSGPFVKAIIKERSSVLGQIIYASAANIPFNRPLTLFGCNGKPAMFVKILEVSSSHFSRKKMPRRCTRLSCCFRRVWVIMPKQI